MARTLVAIAATLCTFATVYGQPIQCSSDVQCQSNYYCVHDVFICRQCLNCEELKREPPRVPTSCVKSLVTCGGCMNGLVEDRSDLSAVCVPPDFTNNTTTWWWWVVGVGVLVVVVVVFVVLYLWYYVPNIGPKIFNRIQEVIDFPATSTSVQHAFNPAAADQAPSAPDCPPPYYETTSPLGGNPVYSNDYDAPSDGEVSDPFIKRAPSGAGATGGAREAAGSQAAFVYNKPHYVRGPHLPYDEVPESEAGEGDERYAFTHDEDTMESTWSPAENVNSTSNTDGAALVAGGSAGGAGGAGAAPAPDASSMLVAARNSAARPRQQDTNNNRNGSDSIGASEGGSSISCPVIINVVQTIGSLQQTNKFTH